MKKKILAGIALVSIALITNLNVRADDPPHVLKHADEDPQGGGGTSCTVTSNCFNIWGSTVTGSVSCTGTNCERDYEWVKCDGVKTKC